MVRRHGANVHRRQLTMHFDLRNHPAQARHPRTDEPLFDDDGNPVPLISDQRAIYMDGVLIGYCSSKPGGPVSLIYRMPDAVNDAVKRFVENEIGTVKKVCAPPHPEDVKRAERDFFEDEDDTDTDLDE